MLAVRRGGEGIVSGDPTNQIVLQHLLLFRFIKQNRNEDLVHDRRDLVARPSCTKSSNLIMSLCSID